MSHQIYYDKQFIKTLNGYLPLTYSGSNNCYEATYNGRNGRRERSWRNWSYLLPTMIGTEEQILSICDKFRSKLIIDNEAYNSKYPNWDIYDDKKFGYFAAIALNGNRTSNSTYNMFKNMFVDGIKRALTVEQLKEFNVIVSIKTCNYSNDKIKELGLYQLSEYVTSTEHLEELIVKVNYLESFGIHCYATISATELTMKRIRYTYNLNNPKKISTRKKTLIDKAYVFKCELGYMIRLTKYGFKYSYTENYKTKKTYSLSNANSILTKLNVRTTNNWVIEEIKLTEPILK